MSKSVPLKKCNTCQQWKPRTTEFFYRNKARGKSYNQYGEQYLRSSCKECIKARENKKYSNNWNNRNKERNSKIKSARQAAYRRLAQENEGRFQELYAEELFRRRVRLKQYKGIQMKQPKRMDEEGSRNVA